MPPAIAGLKSFKAVYAITLGVGVIDAVLVSMTPQGVRLDGELRADLVRFAALTAFGLLAAMRLGRPRLAAASFAYANVCALRSISVLAHLTPAYLGRDLPFVDADLQGLSLLAIPVQGAHVLSDMVVGGMVGIVVIAGSGPIVRWRPASGLGRFVPRSRGTAVIEARA